VPVDETDVGFGAHTDLSDIAKLPNSEVSTYSDQVRFDAISRHGPDRLKISVRYPPLPVGSPIQFQKAVRVGYNNFLRFGPNLEKGELHA